MAASPSGNAAGLRATRACRLDQGVGDIGGTVSRQPAPYGGGLARDSFGGFFWGGFASFGGIRPGMRCGGASGVEGRRLDCRQGGTEDGPVGGRARWRTWSGEAVAGRGRPKDEARRQADKEAWQAEEGHRHGRLRAVAKCATVDCTLGDYEGQGWV